MVDSRKLSRFGTSHFAACLSGRYLELFKRRRSRQFFFSIRPLTCINVHSSFNARDIYYYQKLYIFDYLWDYQQPCSLWSTISEVNSTIKKLQHFREVPVLVHLSIPWDMEIRPWTSGSTNECWQWTSHSTEWQFPTSITSISRSLFTNSDTLTKSFTYQVLLFIEIDLPANLVWQAECPSTYM